MRLDLNALKERLPSERWYGDKTRTIASIDLVDLGVLEQAEPSLVIAIVKLTFDEGEPALYHLPLLVERDGSSREATEDPGRLQLLGEFLARPHPLHGEHGAFHFSGPGLNPDEPPGNRSVRPLDAEQSNTSVVLDEAVILKFLRKVEPGPNPDLELTRLLTNEGFPNVPSQVAEITYESDPEGDEPYSIDLATAQHFVTDGIEGWRYALDALSALYDEIHDADVAEDRFVLTAERAQESLDAFDQLGDATALMHVVLSRKELDPDMLPEPVEDFDLKTWLAGATDMLRSASAHREVADLAPAIEERLESVVTLDDSGKRIRVHGDYHLGQVLLASRRWLILDFEGEPARPLEGRREKQHPMKDVAGMLRSFSYAAHTSLFDRGEPGSEVWNRLEKWAGAWEALARERFLSAYFSRSVEGSFLPDDRGVIALMIDFFELDKALYEVVYELNNRPHWVRIPLRGIEKVLARKVNR